MQRSATEETDGAKDVGDNQKGLMRIVSLMQCYQDSLSDSGIPGKTEGRGPE